MEIKQIDIKENEPNYTDTKPYLLMLLIMNCFLQYLKSATLYSSIFY